MADRNPQPRDLDSAVLVRNEDGSLRYRTADEETDGMGEHQRYIIACALGVCLRLMCACAA